MPHPTVVLHGGGAALACGLDGQLLAEEPHGLFAGDTRVLSTYRISIGGLSWRLLGRTVSGHATARWEYESPPIRDPDGEIPAGALLLSIRRRLDGGLHDDLHIHAFDRPVRLPLALQLDADFADIFEVKGRSLPPRVTIGRRVDPGCISLTYARGSFRRGLRLSFQAPDPPPTFVGALVVFNLILSAKGEWRCCLQADPEIDGEILASSTDPHGDEPEPVADQQPPTLRTAPILERPFERGCADLRALAVPQWQHPPYVAAGVPWFLTLFGRDSLIAALMAGLVGCWPAAGALAALGPLQAAERDDWRDAEPGKLPHELRRGELARRGEIPHTPYYGTHDAPALYCLTLWHAWRWTGNRRLLDDHLETARVALRWCERDGDRDGDGLLEYGTRSAKGYYNQGWKDAGDAILHADGRLAPLPLATVELQGYLFGARVAMAELLEIRGDRGEADRLRRAASELRAAVEERYWLDDEQFYALALDGQKRHATSIASNPGQLLWTGLPSPERVTMVARRLLAPDLFSGWGLRTLSSEHPAYNPLSYQRGSVWPHDTLLAAAGLWRYGLREEASTLLRAILEAACAFEEERLPELFCGLERAHGLPVPYAGASIPQAWAAAAPILAAQLFVGLVPDAPRARCFISPWLPTWLPRLEVRGISVGSGRFDICLARRGAETVIERLEPAGVEVIHGTVEAPLWGAPPRDL